MFGADSRIHEVRTNAQGIYRLPALPVGPLTVTVMGEGFAPDLKKIVLAENQPNVDFQLKPGKTVRFRFVDSSGKPVPEVSVWVLA